MFGILAAKDVAEKSLHLLVPSSGTLLKYPLFIYHSSHFNKPTRMFYPAHQMLGAKN